MSSSAACSDDTDARSIFSLRPGNRSDFLMKQLDPIVAYFSRAAVLLPRHTPTAKFLRSRRMYYLKRGKSKIGRLVKSVKVNIVY